MGLILLIVSFPFAYQSSYPNLSHCGEVVILAHALASQIRGSYKGALALATVAVFDKPVMGYVYGALLLMLIVFDLRRRKGTFRDFIDAIIPAAIVLLVLAVMLTAVYGARSFVLTILPVEGASSYMMVPRRFLGAGSYLWNPASGFVAYFLDIPGFWMASTLFLLTAAAAQAYQLRPGKGADPRWGINYHLRDTPPFVRLLLFWQRRVVALLFVPARHWMRSRNRARTGLAIRRGAPVYFRDTLLVHHRILCPYPVENHLAQSAHLWLMVATRRG